MALESSNLPVAYLRPYQPNIFSKLKGFCSIPGSDILSVVPQGSNGQCDVQSQKTPERKKDYTPNVARKLET